MPMCVINSVEAILLGQLLVFHIWLRQKGITTYELIVRGRQKKPRTRLGTPPSKDFLGGKNRDEASSQECLEDRKSKVVEEDDTRIRPNETPLGQGQEYIIEEGM